MSTIYAKHPPNSQFRGLATLNLGCGFAKFRAPNVVNLDVSDECRPDVLHDLNDTPLPFGSGTFDIVLANHVFEHLPKWWELFCDCARVLRPGGRMEVWVPHFRSIDAVGCRDHVVAINRSSFMGTHKTFRPVGNALAHSDVREGARWLALTDVKAVLSSDMWWLRWLPQSVAHFVEKHFNEVVAEEGFFFRKITVAEFEKDMKTYGERRRDGNALSV